LTSTYLFVYLLTYFDVFDYFLYAMCYGQLEKHFGNPRDIEFAVDKDDMVYLLQVSAVRL